MSAELQKKLYEMEVTPPDAVWAKLSDALDEINADNKIAALMERTEVDPGISPWEKIAGILYGEKIQPRSGRVVNFKRLAVAALLIGVLLTTYFIFIDKPSDNAVAVTPAVPKSVPSDEVADAKTPDILITETPLSREQSRSVGVKDDVVVVRDNNRNRIPTPKQNRNIPTTVSSHAITGVSKELEEKTFNQSLDDLSLVAAHTGYMTMVSADGRLVKIPERYMSIAPYLQDKSEDPNLLDFLFEEGAYWKDKFREWRQKLAQSDVTPSHDNFFDIITLLKTIQEN